MGCFNGTCVLSNLPILDNEPIKIILLAPSRNSSKSGSGIVYPTDFYEPVFLPFNGQYNDYGGAQNIVRDENYNISMKALKAAFGNVIKVDKHDYEGTSIVKNWELEDFLYGITRGDLSHKTEDLRPENKLMWRLNNNDKPNKETEEWVHSNLCWAMIRKDIYDYLVEDGKTSVENYRGENKYEYLKDSLSKQIKYLDSKKLEDMFKFDLSSLFLTRMVAQHVYTDSWRATKEHRNSFSQLWIEFTLLHKQMESLRLCWHLPSGHGSQDQDWKAYVKFSNKIINISNEKIKEEEEFYE